MLHREYSSERVSLASIGSKAFFGIMGAIALIVVVAGLISGIGVLASLFTLFVLAIVIYFGSLAELAGSIVVGCILKLFVNEIQSFATIWWTGESAKVFFGRVNATGYFSLIVVVFFLCPGFLLCSRLRFQRSPELADPIPPPFRSCQLRR